MIKIVEMTVTSISAKRAAKTKTGEDIPAYVTIELEDENDLEPDPDLPSWRYPRTHMTLKLDPEEIGPHIGDKLAVQIHSGNAGPPIQQSHRPTPPSREELKQTLTDVQVRSSE